MITSVSGDRSDVCIEKGMTYVKLVCEVSECTLWYESNESIGPSDAGHRERIELGTYNKIGKSMMKGDANATVTQRHVNGSDDRLTSEIWIDISNSNYSTITVTCGTDNVNDSINVHSKSVL